MTSLLAATSVAESSPAGGAAIGQIVIATLGAGVLTTILLVLGLGHRSGKIGLLGRWAEGASRMTGLPPWAALPTQISTLALITALFGMLWDISLHIDNGRDEGPLANPAHYFILLGLFGIFAAGLLAIVLPEGRPSRASVRITRDWYAPVGGLVFLATSSFSLIGFPLDDVWHRLFGQDVTLWGPTHLMLIGGAGLTLLGQAILLVEGRSSAPSASAVPRGFGKVQDYLHRMRYAAAAGGLLIGMSTFQAEFDFGVPQFRLLFHPVLLAFAAGFALTIARMYGGRGAALWAAVFFIVVRGIMAVLVGPVFGQSTPYFPLYVVEALAVEAVALFVSTRRPYTFGALAGLAVGTVGFLGEYAWTQVGFPIAWPSHLLLDGAVVVPLTGVAAGLIGAFVGTILAAARRGEPIPRPSLAPSAAALVAICAVVAFGLNTKPEPGVQAVMTLSDATPGPDRTVNATVRIEPASAAKDADWVTMTAWQGKGFHLDHLEETAPGVFRTTEPVPVHGTWKALVRLHKGDALMGVPVYLPRDTAIPAPEVPAQAQMTRAFTDDKSILQREAKDGVSQALWSVGYAVVGLITLSLVVALAWALTRISDALGGQPRRRRRRAATGPAVPAGGAGAAA
ncbi:hypothetical protein [Conexibacter sp. SYSU D00693]|uniref:hypothetical protein n=1 Tax=Conexibacter sp. SYSU D00693 TaxID=2812560 RepID=UPI00196AACBE|nr:hypothetical protein [Conexibacter sp. SYSU D00693]